MKPSTNVVSRLGHWSAFIASFLLVTGLLAACEAIQAPEDIIFDNPVDPGGDVFVPPTTTITSGPADGSTVNTDLVTFTWDGNANATLFQVRITGIGWPGTWGQWGPQRSFALGNLDEMDYTFEVRSGYPTDSGDPVFIDDTPESVTFTVDAMQGPALRMTPTRQQQSINATFPIDIVAEDVTDLTMTQIRIAFDSNLLQYADNYTFGSFLTSNGGDVLQFTPYVDQGAGIMEFNFGIAGASPPGVSGTGVILTVYFRAINSGTANIGFRFADTFLRNHLNSGIPISTSDLRGALVIIP